MAGSETQIVQVIQWIGSKRRHTIVVLGMSLLPLIAVADYVSGTEISFSIFYLLPVAAYAWYLGRREGAAMSLGAAATWLAMDLLGERSYAWPLIPYWNALVRLGFFALIAVMLARLKKALEREQRLSRVDPVTGGANGRAFSNTLTVELERMRRFGHPLAVAYLDCDNFKVVNDQWGHAVGDEVLRTVVQVIVTHMRRTDTVARLGGDEFAVLMPETESGSALVLVERLRGELLAAMGRGSWPVTFSIGVVSFTSPPVDADDVIRRADGLMYDAKRGGKNAIVSMDL